MEVKQLVVEGTSKSGLNDYSGLVLVAGHRNRSWRDSVEGIPIIRQLAFSLPTTDQEGHYCPPHVIALLLHHNAAHIPLYHQSKSASGTFLAISSIRRLTSPRYQIFCHINHIFLDFSEIF